MSLDAAKCAIDGVARLPATAPEPNVRDAAMQALKAIEREVVRVQENAKGYPKNTSPIRADVWMDGAALRTMSEGLAALLNQRGLTDLEEKAQSLRCVAVLAVQSHYHSIVGPAMVACAECNERLGNAQRAFQMYQALVADFAWIVEEWAAMEEAPTDEDRGSLECLALAIGGVLKLRPDDPDAPAMQNFRQRCADVLARQGGAEPGFPVPGLS